MHRLREGLSLRLYLAALLSITMSFFDNLKIDFAKGIMFPNASIKVLFERGRFIVRTLINQRGFNFPNISRTVQNQMQQEVAIHWSATSFSVVVLKTK